MSSRVRLFFLNTQGRLQRYHLYPVAPPIVIPNIFIATGYGVNDEFHRAMKGFKEVRCSAFLDILVYKSDDVNGAWNSDSKSGRNCPPGTYYFFKGTDINNKDYQYKGYVQLVR